MGTRTPTVLQMEDQDCGPACLAIVLGYHGRRVPLHALRTQCGAGRDGATAAALARVAREHGLDARGRRTPTLDGVELPAIAFWQGRHFVVVERLSASRAWIN